MYEKKRILWISLKYPGSHGSLYLTDRRVVFCATAIWKYLFIGNVFEHFVESRNIRWESDYAQIAFTKGNGLNKSLNFITLNVENTNIVDPDDFMKLLNELKA